ncbi:hypothetical protein DXB38_07960 [Blautia obeum]|uniref:Uncharacterized protein n=1 Tax=Blautia obeum TaxID=40520 RepID=A0A3E5EFR5_9FIRM|nr:hypothetical protein DXB38_07960 [Blautia obeum]
MLDILNSQEEEKIGTELLFLQEPLGVLGHVLTVLSHQMHCLSIASYTFGCDAFNRQVMA